MPYTTDMLEGAGSRDRIQGADPKNEAAKIMLIKYLDGTSREFEILVGANLIGADLIGADLSGAKLSTGSVMI